MASIAQVSGVDAVVVINLIVVAAKNATTHRHNCEQLAEHVRLIGNLLEKLKPTEVMRLPATREPLVGLEAALGRALELVESCKDRSYLYMLAMGWSVVYQFRRVQNEIDRFLKLVPLISLVHDYVVRVQVCFRTEIVVGCVSIFGGVARASDIWYFHLDPMVHAFLFCLCFRIKFPISHFE